MSVDIFQLIRVGDVDGYNESIDAVDINITDRDDRSLLFEAVVSHSYVIARDLISRGVNLNKRDKNGQTVLHFAAIHNDVQIADLIVEAGADVNIVDDYGNNALWTATFNARGEYEIVKLYVNASGDPYCKNGSGRTPLDFAEQINDEELVRVLKSR